MTDDFSNEIPRKPLLSNFTIVLLIAVFASLMMALVLSNPKDRPKFAKEPPPVPELVAEGWLNGPGPTPEELAGKARLYEAWAYWCGPCLAAAPHTVALYEKFRDRVVFIGLTAEGKDSLDKSEAFLKEAKIPWPNAYGAGQTLSQLVGGPSFSIPEAWLIDKQGRVVWQGHPLEITEPLLDELLK